MSEDLKKRITELEAELKTIRLASMQWEEIQRTYQKSNDRLQLVYSELNQINERLTMAFNASHLVWWDWDFRTGKLECSEIIGSLLMISKDKIPGTFPELMKLVHPEDVQEVRENVDLHLGGQAPYIEAEFRIRAGNDGWRWVFNKGKIVEKDIMGKPVRLVGVMMDFETKKIHERHLQNEFEKADCANKAKSNFLANMSHEIYTPLSGVVGMSEILKQSSLTAEQREYIEIIEDSATNLLSVFNTIMDYLKIESGQIELENVTFNPFTLIDELVEVIHPEASEKNLQVNVFTDPNVPLLLRGDPSRLKQVLRVFADNGVKFTEAGEIGISMNFLSWDEDSVDLEFKVSDTGIGISEDALKKLFTSFTRITPTTGKYGGSGLGLAIAKHLINRMKGEVSVESVTGKGSVFTFTVQMERIPGAEHPVADPMLRGIHALIIDQNPSRAEIIRQYFSRLDIDTHHCLTLTEGMQEISHKHKLKKPFGLVMADCDAAIAGLASFRHNPSWNETNRMLICSRSESVPAKVDEMGFTAVLERPFNLEQLLDLTTRCVSRQIPQVKAAEQAPKPVHSIRRLNILLAEDNLINQKVAKVTLTKLGHDIDVAENGEIAVSMFMQGKYDLILMDIFMPVMDGLKATREIRKIELASSALKPVHICAISANAESQDEEKCFQAGVNSYIAKPFKLEELIEVLENVR